MGDHLITVRSGRPGASPLTIVDGDTATGYTPLDIDLDSPAWKLLFSGLRGTLGARAAGSDLENRSPGFGLRVRGSSKDDLHDKLSALYTAYDELRRFGGTLTWRTHGQTYRQHFDVLAATIARREYPRRYAHSHLLDVDCAHFCAPYALGDPMDVADGFAEDTLSDYTFDGGAAGNVAIAAGELDAAANLTTENRALHTATGYTYGDHQASVKSTPGATITSYKSGVVLKRIAANSYLEVYVDDNGTNSRLRLDKIVAGARTNLSSTNLGARIADGVPFWVRGRIEGNVVFLEHFTTKPVPHGSVTTGTTASYTLTTAEATTFGILVEGTAGWVWTPQHTAAKLDDFEIAPFTYENIDLPEAIPLRGRIPGDAPAQAAVELTCEATFALIGWWNRQTENYCWNGDFEGPTSMSGWEITSVPNINGGAGTGGVSIASTPGKFERHAAQVALTNVIDRGAHFRMFKRFRRGVTYTAEIWVRSVAHTTPVYLRLGNGPANDKATSSNVALSTSWQKITVTWTPTADRDQAHVAINLGAATTTTFLIDGIVVYEGTVAPTAAQQIEGRGGSAPFGILEAENADTQTGAGVEIVSDAAARSGFAAEPPAGDPTTLLAAIAIDPTQATPDDHTSDVAIECWARVGIPHTMTSVTALLRARPTTRLEDIGPQAYTDEFGTEARAILTPSGAGATCYRFARLGTLRLPTDQGRWFLEVVLEEIAGTGDIQLDYLVCVPAGARAASPSGKPSDAAYPVFSPFPYPDVPTKVVAADLSAVVEDRSLSAAGSAHSGLGGSLIELPPGDVDLAVKLSSLVPDDTDSTAATEDLDHPAAVHVAVTPRWSLARST